MKDPRRKQAGVSTSTSRHNTLAAHTMLASVHSLSDHAARCHATLLRWPVEVDTRRGHTEAEAQYISSVVDPPIISNNNNTKSDSL